MTGGEEGGRRKRGGKKKIKDKMSIFYEKK